MPVTGDIVRDLLAMAIDASRRDGAFTDATAMKIERQIRQDYGGESIYIARSRREPSDREAVTRAYLDGRPIDEMRGTFGVSRATIYRWLKKGT